MSKFDNSGLNAIKKDKLESIENMTSGLFVNSKRDIEKAKKALELSKELEIKRISEGWIWITNGKTSKLVHPDRVKSLVKEGWKKPKTKTIKTKK